MWSGLPWGQCTEWLVVKTDSMAVFQGTADVWLNYNSQAKGADNFSIG